MIISKIKANHISKYIRFNSSFFLNHDAINSRLLEENSDKCLLLSEMANVFNPPIFKRQFCQNTEKAIPYCQSSDVTNMNEGSKVYINKKQALKVGSVVKKDQILVTGFGTIGNVKLATDLTEGISYANNVCRIEPNSKQLIGFIYAFLASKYGKSQLNKNGSGSVVKYIEAPGIKKTLIPIFNNQKQKEIHDLILKASRLRVEANILLDESIAIFEKELPQLSNRLIYFSNIKQRIIHAKRLEASYDADFLDNFYSKVISTGGILKSISSLSEDVFTPGIFKRVRANNPTVGIPYLSGSSLLKQMPDFESYLSRKMKNIDNYILKEGWLALQDAGTIGYVSLISNFLNGISATNNLVRIIPKNENYNYYIYCFFNTEIGQKLLKSLEYGSVQKHIDHHQIGGFKIPIYSSIFTPISEKIKVMLENRSDACFLEQEAINLIENEIESWQ